MHGTPVEWKSEENVFFRLSKYQQPLLDLYKQHPELVRPATRMNEVRSFVESGLRDLSVSRASVEWGIPFPGRPGQTVYVWLDALINYISALGFGGPSTTLYERYWEHGDTRIQLVGKDILRHHAVYWPAFLLSAGLPLPTTVWAHGWWHRDGRKMSKSQGNVVRPDDLIDRFGADALRYFLLREMVFGQDASFSDEAFIDRYNSDLANDLGNTVSRVVTLARKGLRRQDAAGALRGQSTDRRSPAERRGLSRRHGRLCLQPAPWRRSGACWPRPTSTSSSTSRGSSSRPKARGSSCRRCCGMASKLCASWPPASCPSCRAWPPRCWRRWGSAEPPASLAALEWGGTPTNAELPEPKPLFPRIDKEAYLAEAHPPETEKKKMETTNTAPPAVPATPTADAASAASEKTLVSIDQFFQTELKVATVLAAEPVPKSNKLLKLSVDVGEGSPRTLVSGIALAYKLKSWWASR